MLKTSKMLKMCVFSHGNIIKCYNRLKYDFLKKMPNFVCPNYHADCREVLLNNIPFAINAKIHLNNKVKAQKQQMNKKILFFRGTQ